MMKTLVKEERSSAGSKRVKNRIYALVSTELPVVQQI